jgi:glucose/mannose-6-phosphate isomerase
MNNMEALDKIDYKKADPKGMIRHIKGFAEMIDDAFKLAMEHSLPSYYINVKKIVLSGMGGSGQANDIIANLLRNSTDLIVESVHDYFLPNFVDAETLVIVSSYSGNTEETLSTFIEAHERGAKLLAISTGGKLKILADKYRAPFFGFDYACPPRASFPYLFIFLLAIFSKLGFLKFDSADLSRIQEVLPLALKKYGTESSLFGNPAKILAQKLHGMIPVIYATERLIGVANRFKAQLNENSKNFAFAEEFPELNHKSLEGLGNPPERCHIVMLESNFEFERNIKRQNITADVLGRQHVKVDRVKFIQAKDQISEILLMILFGDFVSYYLAVLNHANPGVNDVVDYLKEKLG